VTAYTDSPLLELENIRKHFDDFQLQGIDLDLFRGETHVLVGENGSGKSTLMKLLSGWFAPDSGSVIYKGEPVKFRSIHDARKHGVLYLHQDVQSFANLTVAENIYFERMPGLWGAKGLVDRHRALSDCKKTFNQLGIDISPELLLGSLGYAERQLIAAVRAYISGAELVVFDEPSSAMSEPDRNILFGIVARLKAKGTAIFYISHRMDEIRKVGDRVTVIHQGRVLATQPCDGVTREELVQLMTADVRKERYPRIAGKKGPVVLAVENLALEPILKGVDFHLRQGEILGITGLMGSGRSLLANCLFGLEKPSKGQVTIAGTLAELSHPAEAMARGISLIPEDRVQNGIFSRHDLLRNMTSATLQRFRHGVRLDERFMRQLTREYANEMSIHPGNTGDILETYSGGNQQKVMVSRWLMKRSRIYIMDEPTRGIDVASKVDIYNAMTDMVDKGASIILISSEIEEILGMSDRVLVLAGGRIAVEMRRDEATKEKILEYATADG
jgi:ribose transport system ATP-binding protein